MMGRGWEIEVEVEKEVKKHYTSSIFVFTKSLKGFSCKLNGNPILRVAKREKGWSLF